MDAGLRGVRPHDLLATPDSPLVLEAVSAALTADAQLDLRPTAELVRLINVEDATVADAVAGATVDIAAAIDAIVERLERGGRLDYVGAGTSGRIAAADAAECGPTFTNLVEAVTMTVDAEEDDPGLAALDAGPQDVVLGVSASGRTPRRRSDRPRGRSGATPRPGLHARLELREHGSRDPGRRRPRGDRRLDAHEGGTAQKLVLNTISTVTMVKLGKTFGNLMVDVEMSNEKLRVRALPRSRLQPAPRRRRLHRVQRQGRHRLAPSRRRLRRDRTVPVPHRTGGVIREAVADVAG